MKWCGLGIYLVACLGAAILIYRRAVARVRFYQDAQIFCQQLQPAVSFSHQPLVAVVTQTQTMVGPDFGAVLKAYGQLLLTKSDLTPAQCRTCSTDAGVANFLATLGRANGEQETAKIKAAAENFACAEQKATTYLQQKASIWSKLLIIMGIAGVILWI